MKQYPTNERVLLLLADDVAGFIRNVLEEARIANLICTDMDAVTRALAEGAGALIVDGSMLTSATADMFNGWLEGQPVWSDLPVLVVGGDGDEVAEAARLGNARWLERPLRRDALLTDVRQALRARALQHRFRDCLVAHEQDAVTERAVTERLWLLAEAAGYLLRQADSVTMIRGLFDRLARHLDLQVYFNFMVNDEGDALRLDSCAGVPEALLPGIWRVEFGQTFCGAVALTHQPIYQAFVQQSNDPRAEFIKGMGLRVYAGFPLLAGDRLLGTLSFASATRDEFSPDERQLLASICQYAALVKERVAMEAALRRTVDDLAEADRRKNEFLAMLAHELRNPLAPIRNAVMLLRMLPNPPDGKARWALEVIERQVGQLSRLIDDLLDVARLTWGRIELHRHPAELGEIFEQALETVRPLIEARRQTLTVEPPPAGLSVQADPLRLAQALANLLDNAAKYTDEEGRLWLTAERLDNEASPTSQVAIHVRDTGIGITPSLLPHIFDLFSQGERPPDRTQGGLGLGLTLVRQLVEMHGGRVEAFSAGPGQGSEFVIHLPVLAKAPERKRSARQENNHAAANHGRRILVVEDVIDSAESLREVLEQLGHEVKIAHNGAAALRSAHEFKPEVVLLDIGLPGMSGYEVARRLRHEPGLRQSLLVALTGYGQEEDRHRAREAGFDCLMLKPVNFPALEKLLASKIAA